MKLAHLHWTQGYGIEFSDASGYGKKHRLKNWIRSFLSTWSVERIPQIISYETAGFNWKETSIHLNI